VYSSPSIKKKQSSSSNCLGSQVSTVINKSILSDAPDNPSSSQPKVFTNDATPLLLINIRLDEFAILFNSVK
jgi:hypothetical protein